MNKRRVLWLAVCLTITAVLPVPSAAADAANVETMLLQSINQSRATAGKPALVMHAGLRTQARQHSQSMAASGNLNHDGFEARLQNAAPDPAEPSGPPDDGFNLNGACENVANRNFPGEPESQTATGFNQQWLDSPPHRECMLDESAAHNVAGVGAFQDSAGTWWATLVLVQDSTPPTGTGPTPPGGTPGPGAPMFAASAPCGGSVSAPVFRTATVAFSASDPDGETVTLTAAGLPGYATFSSTPGTPAAGTLTASPRGLDFLFDLFGASRVTVTATDADGVSTSCDFGVRATLL